MRPTAEKLSETPIEENVSMAKTIVAGILATVAMMILLGLFGKNWIKDVGNFFVSESNDELLAYTIGVLINFGIGILYAFGYVKLMLRIRELNDILKGMVYGTALMVIAYAIFPYVTALAKFKHARSHAVASAVAEEKKIVAQEKTAVTASSAAEKVQLKNEDQLKNEAQEKSKEQFQKEEPVVVPNATENNISKDVSVPSDLAASAAPVESISPDANSESNKDSKKSETVTKSEPETKAKPEAKAEPEPKSEAKPEPKAGTDSKGEATTDEQSQKPQEKSVVGASVLPINEDITAVSDIDVEQNITASWLGYIVYGVVLAIVLQRRKIKSA